MDKKNKEDEEKEQQQPLKEEKKEEKVPMQRHKSAVVYTCEYRTSSAGFDSPKASATASMRWRIKDGISKLKKGKEKRRTISYCFSCCSRTTEITNEHVFRLRSSSKGAPVSKRRASANPLNSSIGKDWDKSCWIR
jgi:hypothetical protein